MKYKIGDIVKHKDTHYLITYCYNLRWGLRLVNLSNGITMIDYGECKIILDDKLTVYIGSINEGIQLLVKQK